MKLYYTAVAKNGKRVKGLIEAADHDKAAFYLRQHSLLPVHIEEEHPNPLSLSLPFQKKVTSKDTIFFTRQIATMLTSGLTLLQALTILKNETQKDHIIVMLNGVINAIEEGKTFSEALSQYPDNFSDIYISIVRAGETSGLLDKIMLRLAETLEKREQLKSQLRSALLYPLIVILLMFIVMMIMMFFVIPQLSNLYTSLNISLPLPTQIVISFSEFIIHYFLFIIVGLGVLLYYFNKWKKTEDGRLVLDKLLLRVPILKHLLKLTILVEFSRTFGLLTGTGAVIIDSLHKTADVLGNSVYRKAVLQVADSVEQGISVGDAMNAHDIFPPILIEMVRTGEQTGKLDESLMRVADYFEREVEHAIKTLTTAMEPIIMIGLAIGVGFLIISVITPIYKLISSI